MYVIFFSLVMLQSLVLCSAQHVQSEQVMQNKKDDWLLRRAGVVMNQLQKMSTEGDKNAIDSIEFVKHEFSVVVLEVLRRGKRPRNFIKRARSLELMIRADEAYGAIRDQMVFLLTAARKKRVGLSVGAKWGIGAGSAGVLAVLAAIAVQKMKLSNLGFVGAALGQPVDQPVAQPVAHQPVVHQPVVHQPVVHQPVVHQPVVHQPVVPEGAALGQLVDQPVAGGGHGAGGHLPQDVVLAQRMGGATRGGVSLNSDNTALDWHSDSCEFSIMPGGRQSWWTETVRARYLQTFNSEYFFNISDHFFLREMCSFPAGYRGSWVERRRRESGMTDEQRKNQLLGYIAQLEVLGPIVCAGFFDWIHDAPCFFIHLQEKPFALYIFIVLPDGQVKQLDLDVWQGKYLRNSFTSDLFIVREGGATFTRHARWNSLRSTWIGAVMHRDALNTTTTR